VAGCNQFGVIGCGFMAAQTAENQNCSATQNLWPPLKSMILARGHEFHLVPAYITHLVALPVPFTIAAS
jgi:hypothetical protein